MFELIGILAAIEKKVQLTDKEEQFFSKFVNINPKLDRFSEQLLYAAMNFDDFVISYDGGKLILPIDVRLDIMKKYTLYKFGMLEKELMFELLDKSPENIDITVELQL